MAQKTARRPNNSVDFNKLRKRRRRAVLARRLAVLCLVGLLVAGVVALNNYLVEESFTVRLSDMVQSVGGTGYPVDLPGGVIRNVRGAGDHLAVLGDTNLYLYSPSGKQVASFQRMSDSTVLVATPERLLTYDEGAKRYVIHSRSRVLLDQDLEYGVITAAMNDSGDYAVVTSANRFISEVHVYNKKFQHQGTFSFVENIVHAVGLSPKATMLAAGYSGSRDGVLYSAVNLYRMDQEERRASYELPDNLIVDLWFVDEDHIAILSDRQYTVIDSQGSLVSRYSFGERRLLAAERNGKTILLVLEDRADRRQDVVSLAGDLSERGVYSTHSNVQDVALSPRRAYVLEGEVVYTFDHRMSPTSQNPAFAAPHAARIAFAGERLYYFTNEEICQLPRQREADPDEDSSPGNEDHPPGAPEQQEEEAID